MGVVELHDYKVITNRYILGNRFPSKTERIGRSASI